MSSNARPARGRSGRNSRPQLHVVHRKSRKLIMRSGTRRAAPYVIGGAILVLGIVFTVLLEQVVLAQSAFKLAALREELVAAETRHHELLLESAELENSDRIEHYAREQLGMVDSDLASADYIYADISRDSTVPKGQRLSGSLDGESGSAAGSASEEGLAP